MVWSKLRNTFLQNRSEENKNIFSKQKNYHASFLRKSNKQYYGELDEKSVSDDKLFWKTLNPSCWIK